MSKLKRRFLSYVRKTSKCWLWNGHILPNGYGRFFFEYKQITAHRQSYEIFIGVIKFGGWILHKCDNRHCVKPNHLYLGTAKDNARDTSQRKRWAYGKRNGAYTHPEKVRRGSQACSAKLTEKDIPKVIKMSKLGKSQREIARYYNLAQPTIGAILRGESWKSAKLIREGE